MKCLVPGCNSTVGSARFHYFPVNNGELCRTWLQSIRNPEFGEETELQVISQERLMVCSDHFRTSDYHRNFLKGDAVPTVFPWSVKGGDVLDKQVQVRCKNEDASPTNSSPAEDKLSQVQGVIAVHRRVTTEHSEVEDASSILSFPAEEESPQPDDKDEIAEASQESSVLKYNHESLLHRQYQTPLFHHDFRSDEVLVNTQCLLELFRSCSVCLIECSVSIEGHERLFLVTQDCQSCGFHREWRSQPTSADEPMETDHNEHDDEKHGDAASYIKIENTGVTGNNKVPVVTRISPLVRRGKGKTPKQIKTVSSSEDTEDTVKEPVEKRQRRNSRLKGQDGSDLDNEAKNSDVSMDEDLFTVLTKDVELKLVVWCTECNTDASIFCLQHRHKKVFGCAQCGDAQNNEKQGLEKLTVHYDDFSNFYNHAKTEHGAKPIHKLCHECSKFVLSDPESRDMKEHKCEPQTQHVCPECEKRFFTEAALKTHYDKWHSVSEQPCKYCMTVFSDRRSKLKHEKTHLKEEKPYSCPKCEEKFDTLRKRKSHLKSHEIPVKHKCEICRKSFISIIRLMKHKVIHFGEDPSKYQLKPRRRSKDIPLKIKRSVVDLRNQKKSIREIAKAIGISRSTVGNIIRRQVQTGDVLSKKRSGRPKKTNTEDDQIFVSIMTKNPQLSIPQIRQKLIEEGKEMSTSTIRRKLHSLNHSIESAYLDNLRMKK